MKVSRDQVAENRRRILETAARLFRERGFDGVTVSEIMTAAGLTHGAFYGHFTSKEDLIAHSFAHVLAGSPSEDTRDQVNLADYAKAYLSEKHRDQPGNGCLFASLGTEAVRTSAPVRPAMTEAIRRQIETFSRTAPGETPAARRRAAIGSWSAMVGALVLARIADDPVLSSELLDETRAWLGG